MLHQETSQDPNMQNNQDEMTPDMAAASLSFATNLSKQFMPKAEQPTEAPVASNLAQNEPQNPEPNETPPQGNEALETPNPVEELKDTIKEEIGGLRGFIQKLFGKEEKESETDKTN